MAMLELGLDTFGDVTVDAEGSTLSQAQVLRNVVEEAVLADRLGLDFIGVGEHHRADFAVSAPEVVLAAIAAVGIPTGMHAQSREHGPRATRVGVSRAIAPRAPGLRPDAAKQHVATPIDAAMLVIGGTALLIGLSHDGEAGRIVSLAGAVVGVVGLVNYLR